MMKIAGGIIVGLLAGIFLYLPLSMAQAFLFLFVLHLKEPSPDVFFFVSLAAWSAVVALLSWMNRFRFNFSVAFLIALPWPTLVTNYMLVGSHSG